MLFSLQQNFSTTCCIPFVLTPKEVLIKIFWLLLLLQWLMLEWIVKKDAPSSSWTVAFTDLTVWFSLLFQINAFCLCDLHGWHKKFPSVKLTSVIELKLLPPWFSSDYRFISVTSTAMTKNNFVLHVMGYNFICLEGKRSSTDFFHFLSQCCMVSFVIWCNTYLVLVFRILNSLMLILLLVLSSLSNAKLWRQI